MNDFVKLVKIFIDILNIFDRILYVIIYKGGNSMNALGRHILAEIYGCDCEILNNRSLIEKVMVDSALKAGAEVRETAFHEFSPQGISGVVIISESHLTIHTWLNLVTQP